MVVKKLINNNFSNLRTFLIEEKQHPGTIKLVQKPASSKLLVFVKLILCFSETTFFN